MDTMTFGGVRAPATTVSKYGRVNSRRRFFTRFLNALRETRLNEARRIIEMHADLLARNDDSWWPWIEDERRNDEPLSECQPSSAR